MREPCETEPAAQHPEISGICSETSGVHALAAALTKSQLKQLNLGSNSFLAPSFGTVRPRLLKGWVENEK